jgi:hypothetical protein
VTKAKIVEAQLSTAWHSDAMSQIPNDERKTGQDTGWPQQAERASAAPRSLTSLSVEDLHMLAAIVIVVAVLVIILGALVLGLATDLPTDDEWKYRVKAIGLGGGSLASLSSSPGGAPFIAVGLLVALGFVGRAQHSPLAKWARLVDVGAVVAAAWLVLFTLLGVVVDLTEVGDAFPEILGALLIDLSALLLLALTVLWGVRAFMARQPG